VELEALERQIRGLAGVEGAERGRFHLIGLRQGEQVEAVAVPLLDHLRQRLLLRRRHFAVQPRPKGPRITERTQKRVHSSFTLDLAAKQCHNNNTASTQLSPPIYLAAGMRLLR